MDFLAILESLSEKDVYVVIEYHHQRGYGILYRPKHLLQQLRNDELGKRAANINWFHNHKGILAHITIENFPNYLVLSAIPSKLEHDWCTKKRTILELSELRRKANEAWLESVQKEEENGMV